MAKVKSGKHIVGVGSRLDAFQTGCDIIGMTEIPIVSQGADVVSGVISLATGDFIGASLSVAGFLPGVGQATGTLKMARRAQKIADAAQNVSKTTKTVKQSEKFLDLTSKGRKVDTPTPNKPAQVDAKPAKKQMPKEKENIKKKDIDDTVSAEEKIVGGKFDTGKTYDLHFQIEETPAFKVNRNIQSSNCGQFIKSVETGKPYSFYFQKNPMPKWGI